MIGTRASTALRRCNNCACATRRDDDDDDDEDGFRAGDAIGTLD